jgi:hypothetical protein
MQSNNNCRNVSSMISAHKRLITIFFIGLVQFITCSCSKKQLQSEAQQQIATENYDNPTEENDANKFEPLIWESTVKEAKSWSNTIYSVIQTEESQMLGQNIADDLGVFCPKYQSLNDSQRLNFWGMLIVGISKFESNWNPATYYVETNMGKDPVTGRQVASEGLLQLSYQDQKTYNLNCGFNWALDKNYSSKDPRKTILDPVKNLRCGIKILAQQLKNQRAIIVSESAYWAVIKKGGAYSKIREIAAITKKLSFCQ